MFENTKAFSGFAVDDIAARAAVLRRDARPEDVDRGQRPAHAAHRGRPPDARLPQARPHARPTYTILNFPVDDIDAAVDALAARGVRVRALRRHASRTRRGVMRAGGPYIAWFTDPAGNVLSVLQER